MRLFRPCFIAGWLYPDAIPQLLDILNKYEIKALFFCNGRASEKYPDLIKEMISKGHIIGNHGYNHLNGWITSLNRYVADIMLPASHTSSGLFRPPYGRLRFDPVSYTHLRAHETRHDLV